jgi:hypothetical protein
MSAALAQSPVTWRSNAVPAEFAGQARALRNRLVVVATECNDTINRITMPLLARFKRSPVPRQEMLAGLAREWRTLPAFGRLDLAVTVGKRSLHIEELRCVASDFRAADWTVGERSISVCGIVLDVAPHKLKLTIPNLVSLGAHATGRWYQRGMTTTDQQFMADMHALARSHTELASGVAGEQFEIPTNGGCFVGSLVEAKDQNLEATKAKKIDLVAIARTFK